MLVTHADRCPTCACPSTHGRCRCHTPVQATLAVRAAHGHDAARFRALRAARAAGQGTAALHE